MRSLLASIALCGLGAAFAACGGTDLKEGEECKTSAECAAGLLCDTTQSPAVCAGMLTPRPDLAGRDLAGDFATAPEDLAGADLAGADLSAVTPPDMTAPPADLTAHD